MLQVTIYWQLLRNRAYHTHTQTRLTAFFPGLPGWAGQYQKGKTNVDFTESRDNWEIAEKYQWYLIIMDDSALYFALYLCTMQYIYLIP